MYDVSIRDIKHANVCECIFRYVCMCGRFLSVQTAIKRQKICWKTKNDDSPQQQQRRRRRWVRPFCVVVLFYATNEMTGENMQTCRQGRQTDRRQATRAGDRKKKNKRNVRIAWMRDSAAKNKKEENKKRKTKQNQRNEEVTNNNNTREFPSKQQNGI